MENACQNIGREKGVDIMTGWGTYLHVETRITKKKKMEHRARGDRIFLLTFQHVKSIRLHDPK